MARDYYEVLQLHPAAEAEVIQAAYRRLSMKYHPDVYKGRDAELRMREINEAYAVLSVQEKRATYDRSRGNAWGGVSTATQLRVAPTVVDLGEMEATRARTASARVYNGGQGVLSGFAVSHIPWVKVTPPDFKGNELDLAIRAQPPRPGHYWYPKGIEVFSNGGRVTIGVRLNASPYREEARSEVASYTPARPLGPRVHTVDQYYRVSRFWLFVLLALAVGSSAVWYFISPWLVAVPAFLGGGLMAWRLMGAGVLPRRMPTVMKDGPALAVNTLCGSCNARLSAGRNKRCPRCRGLVCHICKGCQCKVSSASSGGRR